MDRWELGGGEITLGSGLLASLPLVERRRGAAAVLAQPSTETLAASIAAALPIPASIRVLPDREDAKALSVAEETYAWMAESGIRRDDVVIALGGGALTDVGGFIGATYLRGIETVLVPTTLLGAVDAAIGGKSAVNVAGKNLVGVFRHPDAVVVDLDVLAALPDDIIREGLAEVIKAGAIADPTILDLVADPRANLDELTRRSIGVKVDVVRSDFREQATRMILNFGHTLGHGIELVAGLSHGEAVAVGMVAAAHLSEAERGFRGLPRLRQLIGDAGLPTEIADVDRDEVLALVRKDKKSDAAGLRMVLLDRLGEPVVARVTEDQLLMGLASVGVR